MTSPAPSFQGGELWESTVAGGRIRLHAKAQRRKGDDGLWARFMCEDIYELATVLADHFPRWGRWSIEEIEGKPSAFTQVFIDLLLELHEIIEDSRCPYVF